jgi:hypothetical protein
MVTVKDQATTLNEELRCYLVTAGEVRALNRVVAELTDLSLRLVSANRLGEAEIIVEIAQQFCDDIDNRMMPHLNDHAGTEVLPDTLDIPDHLPDS